MAATKTLFSSSPSLPQLSFPSFHTQSHPSNNSFKPVLSSKANPNCSLFTRDRNFLTAAVTPERRSKVLSVSRLAGGNSGEDHESQLRNSDTGAAIDIKLPRRSLLVEFTCNQCGERTKRLINRLAYEKGLVFVQCGGCLKHHKLVDNLGLIVEYDFRTEISRIYVHEADALLFFVIPLFPRGTARDLCDM